MSNSKVNIIEVNMEDYATPQDFIQAIVEQAEKLTGKKQDQAKANPVILRHPAPLGFKVKAEHPTLDISLVEFNKVQDDLYYVFGKIVALPQHPNWVWEQLLSLRTVKEVNDFIQESLEESPVKDESKKFAQWYELTDGVWELQQVHNMHAVKRQSEDMFLDLIEDGREWVSLSPDTHKVMWDDTVYPYELTV